MNTYKINVKLIKQLFKQKITDYDTHFSLPDLALKKLMEVGNLDQPPLILKDKILETIKEDTI